MRINLGQKRSGQRILSHFVFLANHLNLVLLADDRARVCLASRLIPALDLPVVPLRTLIISFDLIHIKYKKLIKNYSDFRISFISRFKMFLIAS